MDYVLLVLAVFSLLSVVFVFTPRNAPGAFLTIITYALAWPASELAWLWLVVQGGITALLLMWGAGESFIGEYSLFALGISWVGLAWFTFQSFGTKETVEKALKDGLGENYRGDIPAEIREELEEKAPFSDWFRPFKMDSSNLEIIKDVTYSQRESRNTLDIYRPRELPAEGCPVLFQIHGGGWVMGKKDNQALPLMHLMASKGWICVAINYPLSPAATFPAHIEACKEALAWIRTKGHEYGMNSDFVATTGGSAGGHLSSLVALTQNRPELQPGFEEADTSVQACVPFYGIFDFRVDPNEHVIGREGRGAFLEEKMFKVSEGENPDLWKLASSIAWVDEQAPPFMIVHGNNDMMSNVVESQRFYRRLIEHSKNPVVFAELEGAEHAFDMFHSPRTEYTIHAVHRFLTYTLAQWKAKQ